MARGELNPYAAPAETPAHDVGEQALSRAERLASINQRFAAHFVDVLVFVLPSFALVVALGPLASYSDRDPTSFIIFVALAAFLPALAQWFLVASSGQTIGKRAFGTKIVRVDGSRAGFYHGVVLRSWVGCLPALVPIVGYAYVVVDSFYVFRKDRRTLRDRIAGTRVIRA